VSRIRILFSILILGIAVSVPTACNTNSTSSNSSDKIQVSASPAPVDAPTFRPVPVTAGPPKGRDPMMEKGAQFMATVMDHKRRLEKDPKDKEALRFLGNANYDINRFDAAKTYYTRYLEIDPAQPEVRTDLARVTTKPGMLIRPCASYGLSWLNIPIMRRPCIIWASS